ncbi:MAG TPA: hypothetical protein VEY12_07815 [Thermoplasmata archaeon]|nr:hypothetical protein [Thermoplasmata archaeon]
MPDKDRFLGGLDVVGYYRTGGTVFFIFRQGRYSVVVTAELTMVPSDDGAAWFKAECEFQVRPTKDMLSYRTGRGRWRERGQIEGYGRSEDEAILAAVNLFVDRLGSDVHGGGPQA